MCLKDLSFHPPLTTLAPSCCPCNAATLRCRSSRPCHRRCQTLARLFSSSTAVSALLCLWASPAALHGSLCSLLPPGLPMGSHLPPLHPRVPQGPLWRVVTACFLRPSSLQEPPIPFLPMNGNYIDRKWGICVRRGTVVSLYMTEFGSGSPERVCRGPQLRRELGSAVGEHFPCEN